jgi:hypothetical protein
VSDETRGLPQSDASDLQQGLRMANPPTQEQIAREAAMLDELAQGPLLPHLRAAPMSRAPQTHRNADLVIGFFGLLPDEQVLLRICQLGDVLRAAHPAGSEYETGRGQRRERT